MQTGQQLKEEGQATALAHAGPRWIDYILDKLRQWCSDRLIAGETGFRMEEFRKHAEDSGYDLPPSANAWGALPRAAIRDKIIAATSIYVPSMTPSAHARPVRVWEIVRNARQASIFDSLYGERK